MNSIENESKIIIEKKDYKIEKINNLNYLFECSIVNYKILLNKIFTLDIIKLINEINKVDIFEDFGFEMHDNNNCTFFILFKHFYADFGISQKYIHLKLQFNFLFY
jgi:hypothetical protein